MLFFRIEDVTLAKNFREALIYLGINIILVIYIGTCAPHIYILAYTFEMSMQKSIGPFELRYIGTILITGFYINFNDML